MLASSPFTDGNFYALLGSRRTRSPHHLPQITAMVNSCGATSLLPLQCRGGQFILRPDAAHRRTTGAGMYAEEWRPLLRRQVGHFIRSDRC
jgi:hypothetical protein